jgi:hypothetical protein
MGDAICRAHYKLAESEARRLLSHIEPVSNHFELQSRSRHYNRWLCPAQIFIDIRDVPIHPHLQRDRRPKMR